MMSVRREKALARCVQGKRDGRGENQGQWTKATETDFDMHQKNAPVKNRKKPGVEIFNTQVLWLVTTLGAILRTKG